MLGQIKWEQMILDGNSQYGVDLEDIDFAKLAEACCARGYTIERPQDAERVLREALAHDGPTVVQAVVDQNEPPMPGQVTMSQAYKFTKALSRGEKDTLKILKSVAEDRARELAWRTGIRNGR